MLAFHRSEKQSQLVRLPEPQRGHPWRTSRRGRREFSNVPGDQPGSARISQNQPNDHVNVADRVRAEPAPTIGPAFPKQPGIEPIQMLNPQTCQPDTTKRRQNMMTKVRFIRGSGRRLHPILDQHPPATAHPLIDSQCARFDVGAGFEFGDQSHTMRFGFSAGGETAVPLLTPFAVQVPADVDHDIPTGLRARLRLPPAPRHMPLHHEPRPSTLAHPKGQDVRPRLEESGRHHPTSPPPRLTSTTPKRSDPAKAQHLRLIKSSVISAPVLPNGKTGDTTGGSFEPPNVRSREISRDHRPRSSCGASSQPPKSRSTALATSPSRLLAACW